MIRWWGFHETEQVDLQEQRNDTDTHRFLLSPARARRFQFSEQLSGLASISAIVKKNKTAHLLFSSFLPPGFV